MTEHVDQRNELQHHRCQHYQTKHFYTLWQLPGARDQSLDHLKAPEPPTTLTAALQEFANRIPLVPLSASIDYGRRKYFHGRIRSTKSSHSPSRTPAEMYQQKIINVYVHAYENSSIYFRCNMAPYKALGAILFSTSSLAFEASTNPANTSAQAALAPHKTTEQENSADTIFKTM
jgi:hypothetical protein